MEQITSFGRYTLDRSRNQLLEDGKPLRLGVRALDVLTYLVDRAGKIVTKDELIAGVWSRAVVDECNLRTQIAVLRRALGDGQSDERYLVTIPGQGYRFVANINAVYAQNRAPPSLPVLPQVPISLVKPVGRAKTIEQAVERLAQARSLSIVGPGGIGKTTVALSLVEAVAARFPDGICFFDIAQYSDEDSMLDAFASSLGAAIGVQNGQGRSEVLSGLGTRKVLVVLDSCEVSVEAAAGLVEALLRTSPGVVVVATSREALRAQGETILRLQPLPFPTPGLADVDVARSYPAVELFIERAIAAGADLTPTEEEVLVIGEICQKLDGLPLAIELAAGGVGSFGLRSVAQRLDERFGLSMRGRRTALPRHQTLRAMLDWSYDMLLPPERRLLSSLSVFSSTFTIEEAAAVVGDIPISEIHEIFASLIDKSLLHADLSATIECYYLLAITRAYSRQKLEESGRAAEACRRHAVYYCDRYSGGSRIAEAEFKKNLREIPEVRSAITWCFSEGAEHELGVRIITATLPLWLGASLNSECLRNATRALEVLPDIAGDTKDIEMRLLSAVATIQFGSADVSRTDELWERVLALAEALSDTEYQMRALWGLWTYYYRRCEIKKALERGNRLRHVAEQSRNRSAIAIGERMTGMSLFFLGKIASARQHLERSLRDMGTASRTDDVFRFQFDQRVATQSALALLVWQQGFPEKALGAAEKATADAIALGHPVSLSLAWERRAAIRILRGEFSEAQDDIASLRKSAKAHGLDLWEALADCLQGLMFISQGFPDKGLMLLEQRAIQLTGDGLRIRAVSWRARVAEALGMLGRSEEALEIISQIEEESRERELFQFLPELSCFRGQILLRAQSSEMTADAHAAFRECIRHSKEQGVLAWELRAAMGLAEALQREGRAREGEQIVKTVYEQFSEGFGTPDLRLARKFLRHAA